MINFIHPVVRVSYGTFQVPYVCMTLGNNNMKHNLSGTVPGETQPLSSRETLDLIHLLDQLIVLHLGA